MSRVSASTASRLAKLFNECGYVRWQNPKRRREEGQGYKKGDEVRFIAQSKSQLDAIRALLRAADFKPGRPFEKGNQYRQPVYGREEVARLLDIVDAHAPARGGSRKRSGPVGR